MRRAALGRGRRPGHKSLTLLQTGGGSGQQAGQDGPAVPRDVARVAGLLLPHAANRYLAFDKKLTKVLLVTEVPGDCDQPRYRSIGRSGRRVLRSGTFSAPTRRVLERRLGGGLRRRHLHEGSQRQPRRRLEPRRGRCRWTGLLREASPDDWRKAAILPRLALCRIRARRAVARHPRRAPERRRHRHQLHHRRPSRPERTHLPDGRHGRRPHCRVLRHL